MIITTNASRVHVYVYICVYIYIYISQGGRLKRPPPVERPESRKVGGRGEKGEGKKESLSFVYGIHNAPRAC